MALNTFGNNPNPTGTQLDQNFAALANVSLIATVISGTNTLALAVLTTGPSIPAYTNFITFTGVAAASNTGAVTAQVGSLAALNVYKDTSAGPVALTGGEIRQNCTIGLRYDSSLNAGAGGFHLIAQTALSGGTVSGVLNAASGLQVGSSTSTITRLMSGTASITWTVVPANSTQQSLVALTGVAVNDSIAVGPPASVVTGSGFFGYVPAAGTVAVVAFNPTAASLTPAAGLYRVTAIGGTP